MEMVWGTQFQGAQQFDFERREEALRNGVVPRQFLQAGEPRQRTASTIAPSAHATSQASGLQDVLIGVTGVLTALVGGHQQPLGVGLPVP